MPQKLKINFCSFRKRSKWSDIYGGEVPGVDEIHARFIDGIDVWIIQSYLIFKTAKLPFEIRFSDEIMTDAVNVVHRDEIHLKRDPHRGFILGIRADRPPLYMADLTVCQNRTFAAKTNGLYLPQWPQPGLIARNPKRKDKLENIAFFGRQVNLDGRISGSDFQTLLNRRGLHLVQDERRWHDYREVDASVALRRIPQIEVCTKPASKLTNAWLAGVPAVVGDEPAYAELRKHPYDYLAVASPQEILGALERLRQKGEYNKFREHARWRAQEFTREKTLQKWVALLEKSVVPAFLSARGPAGQRKVQMLLRAVLQHAATKIWKRRWRQQQAMIDSSVERPISALRCISKSLRRT
jgi:hypothetical protein